MLGPTKGGKSTFLRELTLMKGFFLSGTERVTTTFWKFLECRDEMFNNIILTEVPQLGQKKD